jgi:hypothetical protein
MYGSTFPINPHSGDLDSALAAWHAIGRTLRRQYTLARDTLLGWRQHQGYLPFVREISVACPQSSLKDFFAFVALGPNSTSKLRIVHTDGIAALGAVVRESFTLVVNRDHARRPLTARRLVNCTGGAVRNVGDKIGKRIRRSADADDCTFAAPVARLLYRGVIVTMYRLSDHDDQTGQTTTVPCHLNKIQTRCLLHTTTYLEHNFGPVSTAVKRPGYKWKDDEWVKDSSFFDTGEILDLTI